MKPDTATLLELSELCEQSGTTTRTVRYYVQQGLLPTPGKGPGTKYGQGHLLRLRLIRQLQREHLPLAEIRKRLDRLDDAQVAAAVGAAGTEPSGGVDAAPTDAPNGSVTDYVARVLGREPRAQAASADASRAGRSAPGAPPYQRDRWDRFRLSDDVEIHVRRPLSREANRRVEKLLEAAQRILDEEA